MDGFPRRFGGYALVKPLARGGMGALYLAVHGQRGLEKLCVVKTALPHLAGRSYVQRFKDEAKVVVRLTHGNLVSVFDAGQVHGEIYLAMEFVEGKDLRAVWNRCAQKGIAFPLPVAAHIVKELVRGLAYAHNFEGLRLVHRDVSPPNVLLSYSGEVKLTDFGLATSTLKLEKTAPGVIFGKVSYMAPEQARAEALDGRCDIYSAGVILWELLTGRQLFAAGARAQGALEEEQDDLLERVRHPQIMPPSKRAIRVPPELDAITMKALAVRPEDRYQTGEELRSDLAAFLARTAPAMDGHQVAHFMRELFGDIILRERDERQALMAGATALLEASGEGSHAPAHSPDPAEAKADRSDTAPLGRRDEPDVPQDGGHFSEEGSRMVGALLAGRYHIKRLRGEGGMGRVYEAEHIEIGKRVAVKVLHPAYSRTPDLVERFRREARAASRIEHPNVVNVTDFGTTAEGSLFFVMEYIEGIELGLLIHREGPLAINHALRITEQMCAALQAAHDAGVIHRDLKPENILLVSPASARTPNGHPAQPGAETVAAAPDLVKVLDFGIAKSDDVDDGPRVGKRLTRPGVAMGTPEYMAPEQAAGHPADPRSDIYATGSILYEMLTGVPPYDGENVMEILHKKANEPPRPILELRPDVPAPVVALVDKAMARDPNQRPQSMAEFARQIREVELILSVTPAPVLLPPPSSKVQFDESWGSQKSLVPPSRLRALAKSWHWWAGAVSVVLALVLIARVATRFPARAGADGGSDSSVVMEQPAPSLGSLDAESASDTQGTSDAEEPVQEENQGTAELAAAEENPKREASPRLKVVRSSASVSQVEARKLLQDARDFLRAQRFDEARAAFERLLHAGKSRGPALVGLAKIAFQQHDYQEAVDRAREGARAGGGAEARVVLGEAYFRLEKDADARKAYEEALKLDPDNRTAKHDLELIQRRGN
jgi:serine/threonine protein kinase/predicted negative regulator of RcsB-dependent stress response